MVSQNGSCPQGETHAVVSEVDDLCRHDGGNERVR